MSQITKPRVFLSYAHESPEFRAKVQALRDWLISRDIPVISDCDHPFRPPPKGWQTWMEDAIDEADVVLVVGSPKLVERYRKRSPKGVGLGAQFEGAIITQELYESLEHNVKFFPILPDGGTIDHIPKPLRSYSNSCRFPSSYIKVLQLILDEPVDEVPAQDQPKPDITPQPSVNSHGRHRADAMTILARPASGALLHELESVLAITPVSGNDISERCGQVVTALYEVKGGERGLLDRLELIHGATYRVRRHCSEPEHSESWIKTARAATSLFFVVIAPLSIHSSQTLCLRVRQLNSDQATQLLVGVLTTAIVGGELRLTPGATQDQPSANDILLIRPSDRGDDSTPWDSLLRQVYYALFCDRDCDRAIEVRDGSGPLDREDRARLERRIRTIRRTEEASFAILIDITTFDVTPVQSDINGAGWPTFLAGAAHDPLLEAALGAPPEELLASVKEFCALVHPYYGDPMSESMHEQPKDDTSDRRRERGGFGDTIIFVKDVNSDGPLTINTGDCSPITNYVEGIASLRQEIDTAVKANVQSEVVAKIQLLMKEVEREGNEHPAKKEEPRGRVTKLLEQIREHAQTVDSLKTIGSAAMALLTVLKSLGS